MLGKATRNTLSVRKPACSTHCRLERKNAGAAGGESTVRARTAWLSVAAIVTAAIMLLGAMPSVLGVAPKPHAVYIRIDGMACGAHIDVEPRFLTLKPGSWVEVVNE